MCARPRMYLRVCVSVCVCVFVYVCDVSLCVRECVLQNRPSQIIIISQPIVSSYIEYTLTNSRQLLIMTNMFISLVGNERWSNVLGFFQSSIFIKVSSPSWFRLLFWTDWGAVAKIEKSDTTGNSRRTIVDRDLVTPMGLALDTDGSRLYWVDRDRYVCLCVCTCVCVRLFVYVCVCVCECFSCEKIINIITDNQSDIVTLYLTLFLSFNACI